MSGVFGESQEVEVSNENPLGLNNQAPDAANEGEPGIDGAAGNGNENQRQMQTRRESQQGNGFNENVVKEKNNQPVNDQPEKNQNSQNQEPIENVSVNDEYEKKVSFVQQKFDNQEDFEKSVEELQTKLGRENEAPELNSQEEAIDYYIQLENELGIEAEKDFKPMQPGDVKETYADVSNLINDINYQPDTPLKEGVKKFINWYREYYGV